MTVRSDRQYVRIYHDDLQRDYPSVWADDGALAAFNRLLVVADKMWPSPPELPRSVKPRALGVLTATGKKGHALVELLPSHCFRIRGHDAERTKRADAARNAAASRWHDKGNADGIANAHAETMPRRDRAENETESTPPPGKLGRKDGTNPRSLGTNPRANGTSPRQKREAQKKGGFDSLSAILTRANAAGKPVKP